MNRLSVNILLPTVVSATQSFYSILTNKQIIKSKVLLTELTYYSISYSLDSLNNLSEFVYNIHYRYSVKSQSTELPILGSLKMGQHWFLYLLL